jgi:hypothetical protein
MQGSSGSPIKLRANAPTRTKQPYVPDDLVDDESYYSTRLPTSAIRYTTPAGNQVIQRGNKRFVIHDEPPPQKRKVHWMLILGVGMIVMLLLWVSLSWVTTWWTHHQLDTTYEFPRVSQADAVVYPGDTAAHPSHYLFLNLNGHVLIVEFPGGDASKSRIYSGPTLFSDNADQVPVTGEFKDVNGDGKIDMVVHIGDKNIIYLNDGTQFKPQ